MSDRTFLVRKGIDTPDDRFEPGDIVKESQLPKKSVDWLIDDGALEEPTVEASDAARKLAAEADPPLDLEDVTGTGAGGSVTKPDVEKALKARG